MKLEFSRHTFDKYSQTSWKSVQRQPSCSMRAGRRTDGHEEVNVPFFAIFRTRPKFPQVDATPEVARKQILFFKKKKPPIGRENLSL